MIDDNRVRFEPSPPGKWINSLWTVYVRVRLRRMSDGAEVEYECACGYPAGHDGDLSTPEFMFSSDGNYGCDCNRHLFFERALGNDPNCGSHPCSGAEAEAYKIVAPKWLADV